MWAKTFGQKLNTSTRWRLFNPKTPTVEENDKDIVRLGSKYGGKTAIISMLDKNSVVISAGAGEDISFEIELELQINCRMYILDPTPDAVAHYEEISKQGSKKRSLSYSQGPKQKSGAYDTLGLDFNNIRFIAKALWQSESELKFYPPILDNRDGSYSLSSIQNNYRKNRNYIFVSTTTIPALLQREKINKVDFLKLDIEGAALEVLMEAFTKGIFPTQIHMELDEMHFPGPKSYFRSWRIQRMLDRNNYKCIHQENCDFLFIIKNDYK